MTRHLVALVTIWGLALAGPAAAGEVSRPPLDHLLKVDGHELRLCSMSLKEATILRVNVYWVGLYLENPKTPPDSIITSNQVKAFVFHFLRDVKSDELGEAWIRDLTAACESDCKPVIAQGRVLARRLPDIRAFQQMAYVLFPDRVEVSIDGKFLGKLVGPAATPAILATFVGPTAPDKLRADLIGR